MKNAIFSFPLPANEPVKTYLKVLLKGKYLRQNSKTEFSSDRIPLIIGGKKCVPVIQAQW